VQEEIPLLTEIHGTSASASGRSVKLSTDLIAEIVAQIRPQIEQGIEKSIAQKFSVNMRNELMGGLVDELANIQMTNQTYLADSLNQHSEQQAQKMQEKFMQMQQALEASLQNYTSAELALGKQENHIKLNEFINAQLEQVQLTLSEKIEKTLGQEIELAIKGAQEAVMVSAANFVDKTKADWVTEIPQMLHASASIIKMDLIEALTKIQEQGLADMQNKISEVLPLLEQSLNNLMQMTYSQLELTAVDNATQKLQAHMEHLKINLLTDLQSNLAQEFSSKYRELLQQNQAELSVYLNELNLHSQQQLEQKLGDTFPALYQGLSNELGARLKQDFELMAEGVSKEFFQSISTQLPEVEQVIGGKVLEILNAEMPNIKQKISVNVEVEVIKLLDSVRLVSNKKLLENN